MNLKEILSVLPYTTEIPNADTIEISSIEMDSRKVKSNSLFVCIQGFTVDGHDYIDEAIKKGAVVIVAEKKVKSNVPTLIVSDTIRFLAMASAKFYGFPTNKIPMIGVTGTNGKTTVTYLLEELFNHHHKKTGIIGTIQMKIGSDVFPINNTTPDSLFLQKTIRQMNSEGVDQVIMEVSSHALDLGRVYGCDFDIAVFTNLSQDHLDYHDSMDEYLRAKSLLFAQLGNSYDNTNRKYAIVNIDDPSSNIIRRSTAQPVMTYGLNVNADVRAENIILEASGTRFTLVTPIGDIEIRSRLIGKFNIYNMLAASSAALVSNIPLKIIQQSLASIEGVSGRFEPVDCNQNFSVIVDYAHTPDSLKNVLQTIKDIARNDIYVVVGCGGDRDRTKRPQMASIAVKYANRAIFTSDNPRTEDPQVILNDMTNGLTHNNYEVIQDRKKAISYAVNLAKENDIILIAGKGHETYQQIGLTKYDFDDREVASNAILAKEKR
ncbi:UDP-N-acetylmuramoyl-L-alanyl-D-glutamate--2,6-diaminopimelate ligase [Ornithinibacillus halophilus]|uniref:UDP-N-acetylmuramoyl-L-alanyl-D-glutamate--2,6-diaminopimelate ligase n=1 Tax=Ornithinibacillus halophilus TaxID=930117 RepID=A0A1M5C464_9BACI|nr:UDP-N-acetylmuramoyl-L-alanyl-D-glutamate--2,6-diaminopimelate ligase [Ornithinibacillus halophilus]SHF49436.1 UDP-N-acetylmuramoylalanyl-D-glutamate--2,6-diaminopimelate ligase [Ornithinibacillus halophilus]